VLNPKLGIVYRMQPEPPHPECRWFDAGAVRLGVEYRRVDPEGLRKLYAGDAAALAELERHSPAGGFHASGVSIHVVGADDGHEYLRFDAFDDDPHYHYIRPTGDHNHWIPFDPVAGGDVLAFALRSLRERLAPMLVEAGGEAVAARLDAGRVRRAVDEVERVARRASA
jgi:hypothetical protein